MAARAVGCPPDHNAEFVCHREDVLNVSHRPNDSQRPQVCFDKGTKPLDKHVTEADQIMLDHDNLNALKPASLDAALAPPMKPTAYSTKSRSKSHQLGCWPELFPENRAEIKLDVLSRKCLDSPIPDLEKLTSELTAWEDTRHQHHNTSTDEQPGQYDRRLYTNPSSTQIASHTSA